MTTLVTWLRALADGSRLRLLALLRSGPRCVEDLAIALGAPQPKVSRHLAYLRRSGIVTPEKRGRHVYYSIVVPTDRFARHLLDELQRHLSSVDRVRADLRRLRSRRG